MMETLQTSQLSLEQKASLRLLWNNEYPVSLCLEQSSDFDDYLASLESAKHFLVIEQNSIIGWFVEFVRNTEIWFAMIIDRKFQGKGIGTHLLTDAQNRKVKLLGWVIDHETELRSDGSIYPTPLSFYMKNGFVVNAGTRLEIPNLSTVQIEWSSVTPSDTLKR